MKKATFMLMFIALVWGGCASSPHVSQDMFLVEQGFEKLSKSNYLEAEAYLRAALDINPNNAYTLLNLGVVFPRIQGEPKKQFRCTKRYSN